ncbi:DNA-J related domain-containing protein [Aliidiomarina celeris]|uniref:DNA-J related domain-containing protein n=1 Tax=Aliidiomarina celeris TaxID=2249428 RepID=UPI001300B853|nr:DNA-J related domain-containing protein [Aliidiomarina celeris]
MTAPKVDLTDDNSKPERDFVERVLEVVADILLKRQQPITEFELIQTLQQPPYQFFAEDALRSELSLFRTHFILFYILYRLRDTWRTQGLFDLEIDTLAIRVVPLAAAVNGLAREDKLRAYYMDWQNLEGTTALDVEQWLNAFWQRFTEKGYRPKAITENDIQQSMQVLALTNMPQSRAELRRHYLKLMHQYHPDKGGSGQQVERFIAAYETLKTRFEP